MWMVSIGWRSSADDQAKKDEARLTETPVVVAQMEAASIEIVQEYSGRIKPLEEFSLAFEIAGRIVEFGERTSLAADPNSRLAHLLATGIEEVLA